MTRLTIGVCVLLTAGVPAAADAPWRLTPQARNLLTSATCSGNLAALSKGLRGAPDDLVWDPARAAFLRDSQHHEYGVGYGQELGVVPEATPAWWMAEWAQPVEANLIQFSGVYPNQPQPDTAWKVELRRDGVWTEHERGVGGWYDSRAYVWGGPEQAPLRFDALRVSVFSRDATTPLRSIHFRGEVERSWLVARVSFDQVVVPVPCTARVTPLAAPVMAGADLTLEGAGVRLPQGRLTWDLGDGTTAEGARVTHRYAKPGIYKVTLTVTDGARREQGLLLVRAHAADTLKLPQVLLDTDQKNEQDDQHYLGYAVFSELDILGVNSVHHGGGQEAINYAEIRYVLELARQSGLPETRQPLVFRGADQRLTVPADRVWHATAPEPSDAAEAILAAARGASPSNPVWVVPVGPGTNVASAILLARERGLDLRGRLRIVWLGGSNNAVIHEFNGDNDPWSLYVIAQSGLETWIMPAPVGARVAIDKRTEGHLYADHPLGAYLKSIVPAANKPLFDPATLSVIISERLGLGWVKAVEYVDVAGPDQGYVWTRRAEPGHVRVLREIDQKAMQTDLFETMKGRPTRLVGK